MIPVKLQLRNFMCYRGEPTVVDFDGIRLACLSGENGAGKSALLDAITWAFWGKARARGDDDLISIGSAEVEVDFEFEIGGDRYRVLRKHSRGTARRSGTTWVDLEVAGPGGWRSITGDHQRETQARIVDLLRMEYDTFINSAFLLQGRADEFTVKSPGERKRVLGDILGLAYYDSLENRAREHARETENDLRGVVNALAELDAELSRLDEYRQEVLLCSQQVAELEAEAARRESVVAELREQRARLEHQAATAADLEGRVRQARAEIVRLERELGEQRGRVTRFEAVLQDRASIEAGYRRYLELQTANEDLNVRVGVLVDVNEERAAVQRSLAEARNRLELELAVARRTLAEAEGRLLAAKRAEEQLTPLRSDLERLAGAEQRREQVAARRQEVLEQVALRRAENARLRDEMKELKTKLDLLGHADARCPLCGTDLGAEERTRIEQHYAEEGGSRGGAYRDNEKRGAELGHEAEALEQELAELGRTLQQRRELERREAALEKTVADAREDAERWVLVEARMVELARTLEEGHYAVRERQMLADLERKLQELAYSREAHEQLKRELAQAMPFADRQRELEVAETQLGDARDALARAEQGWRHWTDSLAADERRWSELREGLAELAGVEARLGEEQQALNQSQEQRTTAHGRLGAAKHRLEQCLALEETRRLKLAEHQRLADEKTIYDELAVAFGKKGIQAMIIESAIPEIEDEANAILGRMTDSRMHVKFETQRDSKKGDTIETLDIKISDELGTRSYEMYSGGEAFRVNFAIRIALSKLLARRAGASLQTLVLDEGFGSQDAAGRERLLGAIRAVEPDFEKILVITHIEELKDSFPVRIEVAKTPEGSRVEVN